MVIPWVGYSLSESSSSVTRSSAKYVQFLSYYDRHVEKGSGRRNHLWPYLKPAHG